jgi:hypothetical protein
MRREAHDNFIRRSLFTDTTYECHEGKPDITIRQCERLSSSSSPRHGKTMTWRKSVRQQHFLSDCGIHFHVFLWEIRSSADWEQLSCSWIHQHQLHTRTGNPSTWIHHCEWTLLFCIPLCWGIN